MSADPPYEDVLNDSYVRKKLDVAAPYLLGERNQARRIRDVSGILPMYVALGVSWWSYWAFLLKVVLLVFNVTAIYFAFCSYKSAKVRAWHFEVPGRIVVWVEFLGINAYLAWFVWQLARWVAAAVKEVRSVDPEASYELNYKCCAAMRTCYKAALKLDFNLLMFLRYVSPPAVSLALAKARRRVYRRYGTRTHRKNTFVDCCCCFCFYGRLCACSALQSGLVLVLAAVALLAVFLKVLQLRFLGDMSISYWSIGELLLFGQFVINMACLDTREKSKRNGKLELLYNGADAEEAEGERNSRALVENLALLVLRHRHSLLTALAVHHSISAEDISFIYVHDEVEEARPHDVIRHEYAKTSGGGGASGGGGTAGGAMPTPPAPLLAGPKRSLYANPEWMQCTAPSVCPTPYARSDIGPSKDSNRQKSYPAMGPDALFPAQVVVEILPRRRAPPSEAPSMEPSAPPHPHPQPPLPPPQQVQQYRAAEDPSERFPFDFYTRGHSVGVPLRGSGSADTGTLKSRYEQHLWDMQGR